MMLVSVKSRRVAANVYWMSHLQLQLLVAKNTKSQFSNIQFISSNHFTIFIYLIWFLFAVLGIVFLQRPPFPPAGIRWLTVNRV